MQILAIETSCDETSLALVEAKGDLHKPEFTIKKHLIASQIETHRPWGGVVPNLAKREHAENLPRLFKTLVASGYILNPQLVTVTVGPGLEPCLWQGIEFAKEIKKEYFPKAKIVPTNHLHGHIYSFLLTQKASSEFRNSNFEFDSKFKIQNSKLFPAVQLLVSGGHTILLLMESLTKYRKLGETRDDAAGEAFDKVARMLGLPYPGGPEIERLAIYGSPTSIDFPRPMIHEKNYDFSFSGLKTSVLYYLREKGYSHSGIATRDKNELNPIPQTLVANVAASFQNAVIDVLAAKTIRAAKEYDAKSVILSGGVAVNDALRHSLRAKARSYNMNFLSADKKIQGDNAAMIAIAGYITYLRKKRYPLKANGSLNQ